ncbi:MAG TPA: shikimate dehydrogenase [Firmicutes bacterium]|nr:shikimate dehydrogenase [Bacillota bacterium]
METFAFIIHPLTAADITRKFPLAAKLPERMLEGICRYLPPMEVSKITGVCSPYAEAEGWFVSCGLTSRQMLELPEEYVLRKIIQAGKKAEKLGAKIVGLGAFTAVVGDAGITVARHLNIPVTTGNSYTVAMALEGTRLAAREMGIDLRTAQVAVVGATGSIGSTCARILARECRYLTLYGRNGNKLQRLAQKIAAETGLAAKISSNLQETLAGADVIITVTSAVDAIIEPEHLKPGAVVCDVARPRDVSLRVARERDDVLVIEGGVVKVPEGTEFNFNFGFPPVTAYACMAETMLLALERRYECFSLGRDITVAQVDEISRIAEKHGFKLAGLRSFERALTREQIQAVARRVGKRRKCNRP